MIAWYKFDDEKNIGADSSGNGFDQFRRDYIYPENRDREL